MWPLPSGPKYRSGPPSCRVPGLCSAIHIARRTKAGQRVRIAYLPGGEGEIEDGRCRAQGDWKPASGR